MSNTNTSRRNIYLPPELDKWFVDKSEESGVKINTIILEALRDYAKKHDGTHSAMEQDVRAVMLELLVEKGLLDKSHTRMDVS